MRRQGIIYTIFHQPGWAYIVGLFIAMNLSVSMMWLLGGGKGMIFIAGLGLLLFKDKEYRLTANNAISRAFHENNWVLACLLPYYTMTVFSWFYAPFPVDFSKIGFIWKTHLVNIFAVLIGLAISRNPKWRRFFVFFSLFFVLFYCFAVKTTLTQLGGEARAYIDDVKIGGGLGGSANWQVIAMYSVVLLGQVFTEKNIVFKLIGVGCSLYIDRCILTAGFATPVGLLLIGYAVFSIVYFRYGKKTRMSAFLKILVAVVGVAGALMTFYKIANQSRDDAVSLSISSRFYNLSKNPLGGGYSGEGEGLEGSRLAWMRIGWNSFLSSPLIGKGGPNPNPFVRYQDVGASAGHHSVVDYLGHLGIIGGGSYIVFVLYCIFIVLKRYKVTKKWMDASSFAIIVMFTIGGVVNPMWMGGPMSIMLLFGLPFRNRQLELEYQYGYRRAGD